MPASICVTGSKDGLTMLDFYYALAWLLDRPLILLGGLAAYLIVTGTIVWVALRIRERKEQNRKIYYIRPSGFYEKRR